jgi:hypothetical protein
MKEELEIQDGGEEEGSGRHGIWFMLAYLFIRIQHGGLKRDSRRTKGRPSPSKGIFGPINHGEDGHPWVWLEVMSVQGYQMMTKRQKARVRANFEAVIRSFVGWGEIDIQVQSLPYDTTKIKDSFTTSIVGEPSEKVAHRHAASRNRHANWIKKRGFKERHIFMGVRLRDERHFLQIWLAQLLRSLGLSSLVAHGNEQEIYYDQIQEVIGKFQNNHLDVRLLTGVETARVIQRCVYRGHKRLPELPSYSGNISSRGDLQRLTDSVARDFHHMMQIKHHDGESSYVTYMAIAKLPEWFDVDWLFAGDIDRRPVEISARLNLKPNEKATIENDHTLMRIENNLEDLAKNGTPDHKEFTRLVSRRSTSLKVKERLDGSDEPMIDVNAFMIVSSDTVEKLKKNREYVRNFCDRRGITLEIDDAYQAEIRRQTYPGTRLEYKDYELKLFCDAVACAMPHASPNIGNGGDLLGIALGYECCPFMYSHRDVLQYEVDEPTGQVFIGPSGEGKTDAMVNRAIGDAQSNMAAIFDEGKGDTNILEGDHDLLVDIEMMNLSEMAGLLNPLYLGSGDTVEEARKESRDLTLSVLWKCVGSDAEKGWKPILAEVIEQEFEENPNDPDLGRIIKQRLLTASDDDPERVEKRYIGRAIQTMMGAKYSEVIFAKGKPWQEIADKYIRRGQVTFVVYGHLTPPETVKEDDKYSEQERLAFLVRDLTNVIYYKFAMNPEVPVSIYKDEIQIDARMGGSISSDHLSRIGRSKGSTISLGSQHLNDVPQGFWENTSTYNFFRFNQPDNAELALRRLNLNVEKGSEEEQRLLLLMMDEPNNGREKYDVIVKTYDGKIGLVSFKQTFHGGRFVSNIQGVEQRRLKELERITSNKIVFAKRARTQAEAVAALIHLGVPKDVVYSADGFSLDVERWKEILLQLRDDEIVVEFNGELKVLKDTDLSAPTLPVKRRKTSIEQT